MLIQLLQLDSKFTFYLEDFLINLVIYFLGGSLFRDSYAPLK